MDRFLLVDHAQFEKKSFQNRNRIRSPSGALLLTVPVVTSRRFTQRIVDVEIADDGGRWRRKHWFSIRDCYRRARYFRKYADFFEDLYATAWNRLVDLNLAVISYLVECLDLPAPLRTTALPPLGAGNQLLIDLCDTFRASEYVSGPGGRAYVDGDLLSAHGIRNSYSTFRPPRYQQLHEPFLPNLSAVDLLFTQGPEAPRYLAASVSSAPGHRRAASGARRLRGSG